MMDVLINLIVINVLEFISVSNHHIVHFEYMQFYLSIMPQ